MQSTTPDGRFLALWATCCALIFSVIPAKVVRADDLILEEIIVSARKIDETAQTVPISINVLSSERLHELNIFDFSEIDKIAPSLQLGLTSPASATLKIRNVGPDFFALSFPAAVAVFVDGAPQSQPGAVFSTMLDIERIEVLSGPQGTLYGQNAPAGLVNVRTAVPDTSGIEGYIETSFGSFGENTNRGALNLPLIEDKLAVRVAGLYAESDGYKHNVVLNGRDANGKVHKSGRAKLLWRPTTAMQFQLSYHYADLYTEESSSSYEGIVPDTQTDIALRTNYTSTLDSFDVFKGVPTLSKTRVEDILLHWDWNLERFNLALVAQRQDLDIFQQQDNSNLRLAPPPEVPRDALIFEPLADSVELRIDGEVNDRLKYLSGVFYSDKETETTNAINNINIVGGSIIETWGFFTNWTFKFNDKWDTSLGARYSDVRMNTELTGFIPSLGELDVNYPENYYDDSYSFKLRHFYSENVLLYFGVDTAFREGNLNVLAPLGSALAGFFANEGDNLRAITEDYTALDPEESIAYELGIKATLLDQRLRWNFSIFRQEYSDHQVRTSPSDAAVTATLSGALSNLGVNAEEIITYGFETEINYVFGEHWSAMLTAAYAKPEIEEFSKRLCDDGEGDFGQFICPGESGTALNDEPLFHAYFRVGYQTPLFDDRVEFYSFLGVDYLNEPELSEPVKSLPRSVTGEFIDDIYTLEMTLGIRDVNRKWSIQAWGKNLTDELVLTSVGLVVDARNNNAFQGLSGSPGAPRSFGITGRYYFGD